jgi:hypothetical protein
MQNSILHRMVIISTEVIYQKRGLFLNELKGDGQKSSIFPHSGNVIK